MKISLTINGVQKEVDVEERTLLADLLRDQLALTGTHIGCDTSQCGCCTVLLDGAPVVSCLLPASAAAGKSVTTVEGIGSGGLHPIQKAFIDEQAAQCGFCLSGVVLTAKAYLDQNPKATDAQIQQAMSNVLCRCFTTTRMMKAIKRYATERA